MIKSTAVTALVLTLGAALTLWAPGVIQAIGLCDWFFCLDPTDKAQLACYRVYCDEAAKEQGFRRGVFKPALFRWLAKPTREYIPYMCIGVPESIPIQLSHICQGWNWTKQLGTTEFEIGYGVAVDKQGNVYVTGLTSGGLDGNINAGVDDVFLVKYDSSGTKRWTRQLGTPDVDIGYGVTVDSIGNVYVTGFTHGGLDGNISAGGPDIFLVKYDSPGTKHWTRQLGTAYPDWAYKVDVDRRGNVYVTGLTLGDLDGNISAGGYDIFLVKYDSEGTKHWTRQLGTNGVDIGYGVAVDKRGNVYVTGGTSGDLDGNIGAGGDDIFLVKYDSEGTKLWTRQLGTNGVDIGYAVAVDKRGNVYVTGGTSGGLDGNLNAGISDIFLVKYDSEGTKHWTRQLGTTEFEIGYGVAVGSNENVYVTGYTLGGLDGNFNSGLYDIFLVKYDSEGTKQWTQQLGTTSAEQAIGVTVDSSGNVYVTGGTDGGLDGNNSAGGWDIFLVKYDSDGVKQ